MFESQSEKIRCLAFGGIEVMLKKASNIIVIKEVQGSSGENVVG